MCPLSHAPPARLETESRFHYYRDMEGSVPLSEGTSADEYRPMTRCECAEISFEAIARRMREKGLTLEQACERTGCGSTCSACIPDLRAHLRKAR